MKLIRQARLRFTEGKSDKVYEVDLCETRASGDERYVVNFRYGRFGSNLREGSKTTDPVSLDKAQKIYDSLVVSKTNKGYREAGAPVESAEELHSLNNNSANNDSASDESITKTILKYLDTPPEHWPLSRIIWRAGELKMSAAADKIAGLVSGRDTLRNYSIAWSLGRCGNHSHLPVIEKLQKSKDDTVRRMANEAYLHLATEQQKEQALGEVKNRLSNELQQCIDTENEQELIERLMASLTNRNKHNIELLVDIYTLAIKYPSCHVALSHVLKTVPFSKKNYFKAFRHIFKLAEFRSDAKVFGIITLRIELTPHGYWGKPFTQGSRVYLRRRSWRTLRKLGEADDNQYVEMAAGVLLSITDEHSKEPQEIVRSEWNWDTRQTEVISTTYYDKFSHFLTLNHIIFQRSAQYSLTASRKLWCRVNETPDTGRVEAFPELWDKHPEQLLSLLLESRCSLVHQFAARALRDNDNFCKTIGAESIGRLLGSVYQETAAFSLELAKSIFDPAHPDLALVIACLSSSYEPAREQGLQWVKQLPSTQLEKSLDLLAHMITSGYEDVRAWCFQHLKNINLLSHEQKRLIGKVIDAVQTMNQSILAASIKDIAQILLDNFETEIKRIDFAVIEMLLVHTNTDVQLLGAKFLLNHSTPIESIPDSVLKIINQSSSDELQGIGVSLLGKYSDSHLLNKQSLLLSYCLSEKAPVRLAVRPIIERLANRNQDFGDAMFEALIPQLFLTEPSEGFGDELVELIEKSLGESVKRMDKNLRWRLIHAQSKTAQKLGAISLQDASHSDYTIKQWAALAKNPTLLVRQWAMAAYQENTALIKSSAVDGLRILNSSWDDSRDFAIRYFRETFDKDDWSPATIIGICDNTRDDVQRFGRELITTFFEEGDGVEYLSKLSQHPSRNVQLFTTNFLANYAADNFERLQQLQPYLITVLSNVCQGRVAKDRVTLFMLAEALKSEAAASLVASIFERQSVTYSLTDKAAYIQGMCAIRDKYPQVSLPIQVKKLPLKGQEHNRRHSSREVSHGV
ncbi:WGR domain-containing protein [Aliikangiella coralliicola]|uniref:WGR domain-containing protein n=1 Tax=Aliikangiella coralliicola TaxID=2592383 RepID=A0A545UEW9_9GAMM|nr:WGR domain-containing protein [Aliikangiella coralliicola]TQV88020.1 WGR domain-containing protein [Aliikangiella coralliicola]